MTNLKYILFVSLLWVSYSNAKVPEKCSGGPIIWCKNLTNAIDCNAYKHCFETVWSTQNLNLGGVCGDCDDTIEKIRDVLGANETKETLLRALEIGICESTIILKIFEKQCDDTVKYYIDDNLNYLLDLLTSNLDAGQICHILGFCTFYAQPDIRYVTSEDALVHYDNIVLHLPASFLNKQYETPLLGSERCTWGPSYWCQNITSSANCHATSHCISKVWTTKAYAEDDDSVCQVCKDMVKQARDQLQSNETQTELREVLEGSCKLIHFKEIVTECDKLADEFVSELTEVLVSEMNPTAVCTVAGLCNSPRIDNLLASDGSVQWDSRLNSCVNCTAAFTALERYLRSAPKNEVIDKLTQLCGQFSSFSDVCLRFVYNYSEDISYNLLSKMKPFSVCHLSGMCAYQYHLHGSLVDAKIEDRVNALLTSPRDDLPCDLCKQLVTHFKQILVANTTEDEFLATLEGICRQTGKFKDECLELVENNFEILYRFLTDELDAETLCKEMNLCPRKNFVSDETLYPIRAALNVPAVVNVPIVPKTVECRFCKSIVDLIKSEMKKPEYEHDIKKVIGRVCNLVSADREKCNAFINKYADDLIRLLTDDVDSKTVCAAIDLCQMVPSDKELCEVCQDALHYIDTVLEDPKTQQSIKTAVGNVCKVFPTSVQGKCHEFIDQYSALIIDVLAEEVDPSVVCPAIKVCPGVAQPERCHQCQNVVGNAIGRLQIDRRIENIVKQLESMVSSAKYRNTTIVAAELKVNHKEDLIDALSAEFNADETCVYLHFCEPTMVPLPKGNDDELTSLALAVASDQKPSCQLCEIMVKMYEEKFFSNASAQEVEQELLKLCDLIHDTEAQNNCTRFVDEDVPRVMELLKKDIKPKYVCGLAKMCPYKAPETSVAATESCRLCEVVVGSLQGLAQDPSVINNLLEEELKICDIMPTTKKSLCKNIVSLLMPQLDQIAMGLPSWFYCSKIDMCPYGKDSADRLEGQ